MTPSECAELSFRTDFAGYIALLRDFTDGDFSLVANCTEQVCGALWGSGNPDISGIGMTVGYLLQSAICLTLLAAYGWFAVYGTKDDEKDRRWWLLNIATSCFFDNAVFFAFAIQITSVVTLARANFGISAEGMGAISMKIAWTVSTLTLLPLLPLILRPEAFADTSTQVDAADDERGIKQHQSRACTRVESSSQRRPSHRFLLFVICWAVSFYPFFSRMAGTFGTSQIGNPADTPNTVISTLDWTTIESACFQDVDRITTAQDALMTAFGAGSWLLTALVTIHKIVLSMLAAGHHHVRPLQWLRRKIPALGLNPQKLSWVWLTVCAAVALCVSVQFWSYFRLRRFQSDMTTAAGGRFPDGQWTFGQIVAVVVFLPVGAEVVFQWRGGE